MIFVKLKSASCSCLTHVHWPHAGSRHHSSSRCVTQLPSLPINERETERGRERKILFSILTYISSQPSEGCFFRNKVLHFLVVFFKWAISGLFFNYFWSFSNQHQYNFLQQINVKNVHLVHGTGIQTQAPRSLYICIYFRSFLITIFNNIN